VQKINSLTISFEQIQFLFVDRSRFRAGGVQMALFPKVLGHLKESIVAANLRHQVIANNIANANVPGFQAMELSFEEHLARHLASQQGQGESAGLNGLTPHPQHIPIEVHRTTDAVVPTVRPTQSGVMRQDGNSVDIEGEMAKLAANQLWYQALIRSMTDELGRLRAVITDRGR
jgi:flagellar basal-body rod protein FlgB